VKSGEKAELMKNSITQLYSKEGRSISYISRLLEINRKTISNKIKEWNLPEPEPARHLNPSTIKFINRNRTLIKSRLDKDVPITEIAEELGVSRGLIQKVAVVCDPVLKKAHDDYIARTKMRASANREERMRASRLEYVPDETPGETWKPILGYQNYEVSSLGRVRAYTPSDRAYHLIRSFENVRNGYMYVMLFSGDGQKKNLALARVVAHTFVDGYDSEKANTVNHKDGNVLNNKADNLEWVSQSQNNKHSYDELGRKVNKSNKPSFERIIYQGKYEFKTVAALARFIGKSETQTRRYLDEPKKHDIQIV
jgi:predicted DNA-binding protein YlxM (UPF0122 family)